MALVSDYHLAAERLHFAWDNSLEPVLEIESGDCVTIDTWDAGGHSIQRTFTSASARELSFFCASFAIGRLIVLSTFNTCAEVIVMKNTRIVSNTSIIGAT